MSNWRIKDRINKATIKSKVPEMVFVLLILALGIAVRVNFVSGSRYPLNDGGLFYSMTEELINNKFLLPNYSLYNHANIPYAYPPLAFYLIGIIHKVSGFSLLSLYRYIPLLISCLTIPVFYLLTGKFIKEKSYRLLAAYLFATMPRAFEWFVMGGGATRSIGFLFAMLSVYFFWGAFEENEFSLKWAWGVIFSTLTILSHPLSSVFLAFSVIVLFIYHLPVKVKLVVISGFAILALTSPWWATVINNHGLAPFLGASGTGHFDWFEIKNLVTLNFGYENPYFLHFVSMLAILGLFSKRKKIALTLGILCGIGYIAIPRGGADYLTAYLPILAVIGFEVITDSWNKETAMADKDDQFPVELRSRRSRILLIFIFVYTFLGAYTYKYVYNKGELRVNESNFQAMEWLRDNTGETETVLLIPTNHENRYWWNDFNSEWLPVISQRESVTTVQGYEWKPDLFEDRISKYWSIRNCSLDYACIEDWQDRNDLHPDFIYFDDLLKRIGAAADFVDTGEYSVVFENNNVMILEKVSPQN